MVQGRMSTNHNVNVQSTRMMTWSEAIQQVAQMEKVCRFTSNAERLFILSRLLRIEVSNKEVLKLSNIAAGARRWAEAREMKYGPGPDAEALAFLAARNTR